MHKWSITVSLIGLPWGHLAYIIDCPKSSGYINSLWSSIKVTVIENGTKLFSLVIPVSIPGFERNLYMNIHVQANIPSFFFLNYNKLTRTVVSCHTKQLWVRTNSNVSAAYQITLGQLRTLWQNDHVSSGLLVIMWPGIKPRSFKMESNCKV